ncbi:MAG TPA: M20/M25/M40 family metallo-hydrolase, partial [Alphaproteobacteria bacterium]|nr:M20/M25/M40 family metallo-hydrolase [Alphaproteobacteria bacterium]
MIYRPTMTAQSSTPATDRLLQFCQEQQPQMLALLKRLVEMESPSDNKAAVDKLGEVLAKEFEQAGGKPKFHLQREYGNHLQADFAGNSAQKPIMLLGHFDTVWSMGTLATMPCKIEAGKMFGPGVYDMKAGIVMMIFALRALRQASAAHRPVTVLLDTDEEVGSASSRPITERIARQCEAVLVLEPSTST